MARRSPAGSQKKEILAIAKGIQMISELQLNDAILESDSKICES
jgi:hypothetical protein